MMTFDTRDLPVARLHQILLGAVAPRPIAFASTVDEDGRPNLAPFSFFNVFSANPPILVFSPARRGRDNTTKDTYENVKRVPECVINMVNYDMVQQMSLASTEYPTGVNEFIKSGLTPLASEVVRPFRVAESPVQMECRVNEIMELGPGGGAGNLVVCEVMRIHVQEDVLDADGRIDPVKVDQVSRMGGMWYSRARQGLFELRQPSTELGIGFDGLPADIRQSRILTGNQLAQLASVTALPDETSVNEYKLTELADVFMEYGDRPHELEQWLHRRAAELLEEKRIDDAWKTLLTFNN